MKKSSKRLILPIAVVLIFFIVLFSKETRTFRWEENSLVVTEMTEEDEAEEKYESPWDRNAFELKKLRDPKTGKIPVQIGLKEREFIKEQQDRIKPAVRTAKGQFKAESTAATANANFINRGPWNIGGRTRALAIDIADENTILAGGISGGVWKSVDQGATWTRSSKLDQHPGVTAIIQDRRSGQNSTWYYGTGERRGNSASGDGAFYFGNGIYKSTDNGSNWTLIPTTAVNGTSGTDPVNTLSAFTLLDELAMDYSNTTETELYAAGAGSIVRTTDGFQTFTTVLGAANNPNNMADVLVTSTGVVYATVGRQSANGAGGQDGVWRSTDGINWTEITPNGIEAGYLRLELGIDPQNENNIWLVSDRTLFKWDDAAKSWTNLSAALAIPSDPDSRQGLTDFTTQQYYDQLVTVHPNNSDVVFIGGTNLFRSTDGFQTTTNKTQIAGYSPAQNISFLYPNHHPDLHKAVFFPSDPNKMITGDDGGVHLTTNNLANNANFPVTWQSLNNGYLSTQFYHIGLNTIDIANPFIIGGMQDNGTYFTTSQDPTNDWGRAGGGDGAWSAITYNSFFVSSQKGNVDRIEIVNNAVDFNNAVSIVPVHESQREEEFLFVNPFAFNEVNQDQVVIGGLERAFFAKDIRTNPGAGDWIEITSPELTGSNANITAMGFSVEPEGVLYMGTDFGQVLKVTNTQGIESNVQAEDLPTGSMPDGYIGAIKVDPADANHVIVTFTNYGVISIWESTDGGQNWSSIAGNLEENADGSGVGPSVRSFEIMPDGNGGNYYFAGTSVGLYMTQTLAGANTVWTQQSPDGIGDVVVSWIQVRPIEGLVVASTHGNGVFSASYDVGKNAFIHYAFDAQNVSYDIMANRSFDQNRPLAYQWLRNGEIISGEDGNTLTVTNGGAYQLRLFFQDQQNTLSNTININLDGDAPEITSIARLNPTDEDVTVTEVTFQVTFNENVKNVDASDFVTTGSAAGDVANVTRETDAIYHVSIDNIRGKGALGLSVIGATDIMDESDNLFSGRILSAETYSIVDGVSPTVSITRFDPVSAVTNQAEVTFRIEFNEPIVNFGTTDLQFIAGSSGATLGSLRQAEAGRVFEMEIIEIQEDGPLGIEFRAEQDIEDESGNAFDGQIQSNETYTIENIITSIDERYLGGKSIVVDRNPSDGLFTLVFPSHFIGDFELGVVNAEGRIIQQRTVANYQQDQEVLVDLRLVPDGLYVVKGRKGADELTVKLLKRTN